MSVSRLNLPTDIVLYILSYIEDDLRKTHKDMLFHFAGDQSKFNNNFAGSFNEKLEEIYLTSLRTNVKTVIDWGEYYICKRVLDAGYQVDEIRIEWYGDMGYQINYKKQHLTTFVDIQTKGELIEEACEMVYDDGFDMMPTNLIAEHMNCEPFDEDDIIAMKDAGLMYIVKGLCNIDGLIEAYDFDDEVDNQRDLLKDSFIEEIVNDGSHLYDFTGSYIVCHGKMFK